MVVRSKVISTEFEDEGVIMKPEVFRQRDRFFFQPIAKVLWLFFGIMILGSCVLPAIAQDVWIRKGPIFTANKENRKPKNATVTDNSFSQTDGSGRTNTITWSIPDERIIEGQEVTLILQSTTNDAVAPLYGKWVIKNCGEDQGNNKTSVIVNDGTVGSSAGIKQGTFNQGKLVFKFVPSFTPSMSVIAYRTDDYSGEMGVTVTWTYERATPGNVATTPVPISTPTQPTNTPVPVSTPAQQIKRDCKKTFIVTGRRQYDGKLVQTRLVVTKRFYDWTDEELYEGSLKNGKRQPPGQIVAEERKYESAIGSNYTPIKPRTKKQDCAGYVMDQLWGTGQYFVTAGAFSDAFIGIRKKDEAGNTIGVSPAFAYKVSGELEWGNLQINDIVVYPGIGNGVGHIAIVKGFEKSDLSELIKNGGEEYSSIIIETKDGEERVYRHDLIKAVESFKLNSTRTNDILIKSYGMPEIWRVDPSKISIVPLTPGECDEPGATTNRIPSGDNTSIGGTWIAPNGDVFKLEQDNDRITGSYRGILGTGSISASFNGKTLSGTVRIDQVFMSSSMPLTLKLTSDGKLEGQVGDLVKVDLILTKR